MSCGCLPWLMAELRLQRASKLLLLLLLLLSVSEREGLSGLDVLSHHWCASTPLPKSNAIYHSSTRTSHHCHTTFACSSLEYSTVASSLFTGFTADYAVWIDLVDVNSEQNWYWDTGAGVRYRNWDPMWVDQAGKDCGAIKVRDNCWNS